MSDLISRQDALKPFCVAPDGTRIPEVDCDNFPVEFSMEFIKKHLLSLSSVEPRGNLISREDVINAFAYSAPELFANRDWFETKINMIPSSEAVSREDYHNLLMALNDIDRALRQYQAKDENSSADSDNRHYIKIYADDEPSVKVEKLYQICGETQNKEVTEWLKEYFSSTDDNWIPVSERLPKKEKKHIGYVPTQNTNASADGQITDLESARANGGGLYLTLRNTQSLSHGCHSRNHTKAVIQNDKRRSD